MSKCLFIRLLHILIASLLLSLCTPTQLQAADTPADENSQRLDVLFIAVDDLNDWIGVLDGHRQTETPNIDRLAQRGMLFTNCHCAAPACNPSRVALMTGIRPHRSGIYYNSQPWRTVLADAVTLPQQFRRHGYRAIGSGKIYHDAFPDPASWDVFYPSKTKQRFADPLPPNRPLNGIPRTAHFDWGPVDVEETAMSDYRVVDWVIEQLNRPPDQPLLLACGIYRPHLPWYVPTAFFDDFPLQEIQLPSVSADDLQDIPAAGRKMARPGGDHRRVTQHKQWQAAVQGYLASIRFADAQVGRLLEALERSPRRDRTMVILWTDHGWHLGEKKHWRKFALWERATHTPLMIAGPGISPGRCDRPVNLIDIYPTLCQLCNLPLPSGLDGQSLAPLIEDPSRPWHRPSLTTHGRNNHALRDERYRYIRYADGTEELYDHQTDPHEWRNVADLAKYAAIKSSLAQQLPVNNAPEAPKRDRN